MRACDYVLVTALGISLTHCASATVGEKPSYCEDHSVVCVLAGTAAVLAGIEVAASSGGSGSGTRTTTPRH
jgi:hypothetical protein